MTTTSQSALAQGQNLLCSSIVIVAQLVSFDGDSNTLVTMDNCASNNIFGDPQDFIGGFMPMEPVEVTRLGEAQATGYGNVSIKFRCNEGKQHEKILHDVWYLPGAAI